MLRYMTLASRPISPAALPTSAPSAPIPSTRAPAVSLRRSNDLTVKYPRPLPIVRVRACERCYTTDGTLPRTGEQYECLGKTYGGRYIIIGGSPRRSYIMLPDGIEFLTLPLRTTRTETRP